MPSWNRCVLLHPLKTGDVWLETSLIFSIAWLVPNLGFLDPDEVMRSENHLAWSIHQNAQNPSHIRYPWYIIEGLENKCAWSVVQTSNRLFPQCSSGRLSYPTCSDFVYRHDPMTRLPKVLWAGTFVMHRHDSSRIRCRWCAPARWTSGAKAPSIGLFWPRTGLL